MFRIGIIGTENSHALAFARIINLPNADGKRVYEDMKVVGVLEDKPESRQIVEETGAEFIAEAIDDFYGKVDVMLITCRKGSLHKQYAIPFIEKGIPCFIDKPFTSCSKEAEDIIKLAKEKNVSLLGGSGCKHAYDVTLLKNQVKQMKSAGNMITGCLSFPADPDSIYDGFFFYSPHLVEMAFEVFGFDVKSVICYEKNKSRVCLFRYDDYDVTLNFTKDAKEYTGVIFGKEKNVVRSIDISFIFEQEVEHLACMLRTGKMPQDYSKLIKHVTVIEAIEKSVETGMEIDI